MENRSSFIPAGDGLLRTAGPLADTGIMVPGGMSLRGFFLHVFHPDHHVTMAAMCRALFRAGAWMATVGTVCHLR